MDDFLLPWDVIRKVPSSEYSSRDGATPSMHVWHHGATTSGAAIEANMEPGGRQLSATGVIYNNGTSVGKVPEWDRPWTSGSYKIDRMALTTEMANGAVDGWTITDATYDTCGRIAAAEYLLYGIPLDRDHHVGHNELYSAKFGWESYPTYCPGPPERVDWIVELGRRKLSSGTVGLHNNPIEEEPMLTFITDNPAGSWYATDGITKRRLAPGENQFLVDLGLAKWPDGKVGNVKLVSTAQLIGIPDEGSVTA